MRAHAFAIAVAAICSLLVPGLSSAARSSGTEWSRTARACEHPRTVRYSPTQLADGRESPAPVEAAFPTQKADGLEPALVWGLNFNGQRSRAYLVFEICQTTITYLDGTTYEDHDAIGGARSVPYACTPDCTAQFRSISITYSRQPPGAAPGATCAQPAAVGVASIFDEDFEEPQYYGSSRDFGPHPITLSGHNGTRGENPIGWESGRGYRICDVRARDADRIYHLDEADVLPPSVRNLVYVVVTATCDKGYHFTHYSQRVRSYGSVHTIHLTGCRQV
jgi:hypothetical protein